MFPIGSSSKAFTAAILGQLENEKLAKYNLKFHPNDIKYIFVNNEEEIHQMVKTLRSIKSKSYDEKTIDILTSKILTTNQIKEDF